MARPPNPGQPANWGPMFSPATAMMPYQVYPSNYNAMYIAPMQHPQPNTRPQQQSLKRPAPSSEEHVVPSIPTNPITNASAGSKDHHVLWTQVYDKPIPDEILFKCKPLYCELCAVNLNSVIQAKMHYEGKGHEKKVRYNLTTWAKANGQTPPCKKAKSGEGTSSQYTNFETNNQGLYCVPCDTSFTSHAHAQQHFSGRNHQRVISGLAPLKAGYFNQKTGKWQRQPLDSEAPVSQDATAVTATPVQVTIETYHSNDPATVKFEPGNGIPPPPPEKPPPPPPLPNPVVAGTVAKFYCSICNVNATSQGQLDLHLNGKNHKFRIDRLNIQDPYHITLQHQQQQQQQQQQQHHPIMISSPVISHQIPIKQQPESKPPKPKKDYSIYRTPSGQYYCNQCNQCVNSENQFIQHCQSKKHKMKESSAKAKKAKKR